MLGDISISSYRAAMAIAIAVGVLLAINRLKRARYTLRQALGLMLAIVTSFFIGARLLNIVVNYRYYQGNISSVYALNFVGFSAVGGALLAIVTVLVFTRVLKKPPLATLDALAIPFLIAFAIMKVGCFCNGCCVGHVTKSIFGINFPERGGVLPTLKTFLGSAGINVSAKRFPTQLYESGLSLALAALLSIRRPKHLFLWAATGFIALRLLVHPLREFPYPPLVTELLYPLGYALVLCLGVLALFLQYRKEQRNKPPI